MCRIMPLLIVLSGVCLATAQDAATTQPTTSPATEVITARVLALTGSAEHKPLDGEEWLPCAVDDEYPPETIIRTGIRSSVQLQIGRDDTYTAMVIDAASKTVISEASKTASTKRVRIGVGYGRVRAGVVEGGLESDFTIDCPVATLSKRGTWNFGLFYERGTDRFEVFLLDQGLVDAFNRVTRERREVLPGEVVTQTMQRWMNQVQLVRTVPVPDIFGQGDVEVAFNRLQQSGLRVLNPEGGQTVVLDLSSDAARQSFAQTARDRLGPIVPVVPALRPGVRRPEGFFGLGRGDELIPIILEAGSPLVQKGHAQAGRYLFRRSALQSWLKQHAR